MIEKASDFWFEAQLTVDNQQPALAMIFLTWCMQLVSSSHPSLITLKDSVFWRPTEVSSPTRVTTQ
jgi:hypothetical protein